MSFGVCSLMDPDKVSLNEQIWFPNTFLHGGFTLVFQISPAFCVLIRRTMNVPGSARRAWIWVTSIFEGRKHFEVSGVVAVACRYWSDDSAVCVALATQTPQITHVLTLLFYSFPAETQHCCLSCWSQEFCDSDWCHSWENWSLLKGKNVTLTDFELL